MSATPAYAVAVDDDPIIIMHIEEILEDAGFVALTSDTFAGALLLLEEHSGHVVLLFTDVELRDEPNGFALARMTAERWPDVSILVASGNRTPTTDEMPAGAIFVAKPFSAEVVHNRIRQLLPDHRTPDPLKKNVPE